MSGINYPSSFDSKMSKPMYLTSSTRFCIKTHLPRKNQLNCIKYDPLPGSEEYADWLLEWLDYWEDYFEDVYLYHLINGGHC